MADPVAHESPTTAGEAHPVGGTNRPTPRSGRVDLPQRVRLVVRRTERTEVVEETVRQERVDVEED